MHLVRRLVLTAAVGAAAGLTVAPASSALGHGSQLVSSNLPPPGCDRTVVTAGSRGWCVSWVQARLNFLNRSHIAVDGVYGVQTYFQVRIFQSHCSPYAPLAVDGVVGPRTWVALETFCYQG